MSAGDAARRRPPPARNSTSSLFRSARHRLEDEHHHVDGDQRVRDYGLRPILSPAEAVFGWRTVFAPSRRTRRTDDRRPRRACTPGRSDGCSGCSGCTSRGRDAGNTSASSAACSGCSQRSEQFDPVAVGVGDEHPAHAGHRLRTRSPVRPPRTRKSANASATARRFFTPIVKYLTPACARPPPGVAGIGGAGSYVTSFTTPLPSEYRRCDPPGNSTSPWNSNSRKPS